MVSDDFETYADMRYRDGLAELDDYKQIQRLKAENARLREVADAAQKYVDAVDRAAQDVNVAPGYVSGAQAIAMLARDSLVEKLAALEVDGAE